MDVLTHGLTASLLLIALDVRSALFVGVLGSIAPDLDVLLTFVSDRHPRWYILTHGGVTHSLIGGCLVSLMVLCAAAGIAALVPTFQAGGILFSAEALLFLLGGTLLHLFLDVLAYPGIPLLYPVSDRKYTLGIFPGPSMALFGLTTLFLALVFSGLTGMQAIPLYGGIVLLFLLFAIGMKVTVSVRASGRTVPTRHPLRWLIVADTGDSYTVSSYHLLRGRLDGKTYLKYSGVTGDEVRRFLTMPELRRQYYHSYMVVVQRDGNTLIFRDPLRDEGFIFYPPYYRQVRVRDDVP